MFKEFIEDYVDYERYCDCDYEVQLLEQKLGYNKKVNIDKYWRLEFKEG